MSRPFEKQAVTNLQRYLRQLAYEDSTMTQPPIDGIFDTVTRLALTEFQTKNNLEPTGVADRTTWDLLFKLYLESIAIHSPAHYVSVFPRNPFGYAIKLGDESFYVVALQFMLRELSRDYGDIFNIEPTGKYDSATALAIKNFQLINNIEPTSVTDKITWDRVTDAYNRRAHEYHQ